MTEPSPNLQGLDEAQDRAVRHRGGPLVVLAGPGTGKTRVITRRIARLILEDGAAPESILVITFSVRAAAELRRRLAELVGSARADGVNAQTIHGFGRSLVMRYRDMLGFQREPDLIDSAQRRRLMREIAASMPLSDASVARGWTALCDDAWRVISTFRGRGFSAEQLVELAAALPSRASDLPEEDRPTAESIQESLELAELGARFDAACRERGWVTYDDFITLPLELLRTESAARNHCRSTHRHVLVDEFQDVNGATIDLLELVCPPSGRPDLCVVGDDDQSIYAFRGADDRAFHAFSRAWPGHATVRLEVNYRSAGEIVRATDGVIRRATSRYAPDKAARCGRDAQGQARVVRVGHDDDTGQVIATLLRTELAPATPGDFSRVAVLGRSNIDVDRVALDLEARGIPTLRPREEVSAEEPTARDLLAWARVLTDPTATWAVDRVVSRPPINLPLLELGELRRGRLARARTTPGALADELAREAEPGTPLARFGRLLAELRRDVSHLRCDAALQEIVTRLRMTRPEELGPEDRHRRVTALLRVIAFARSRAPRMDKPAGLAEFLEYLEDLDEGDRASLTVAETDPDAPALDPDHPGVRLLTAHASKGLEFDTVFVVRAAPPHGFPKTRARDALPIGDALEHALHLGDERSPRDRQMDEERRLFYVACTRAERALVVMCKKSKKRSGSTHFGDELALGLPGVAEPVPEIDADDLLARWPDEPREIGNSVESPRQRADRLARGARESAARALDALVVPPESRADLDRACASLADAAKRLVVAGAGSPPPEWMARDPEMRALLDEAGLLVPPVDKPLLGPMAPPLTVSYTSLRGYERCPRCHAVEHILGLRPPPVGDAVVIGQAVHAALEGFVRLWRDRDATGEARPTQADLLALGERECLAQAGSVELRAELELDEFLARTRALLVQFFNRLHSASADVLEVEVPASIPIEHRGHTHTIRAKLDRIDRAPDGSIVLIDYKTGAPNASLRQPAAVDLQLAIYALALGRMYPPEALASGRAEYWILQTGERGSIALADLDVEKARVKITRALDGMLDGLWPKGSDCSGHCDVLGPEAA